MPKIRHLAPLALLMATAASSHASAQGLIIRPIEVGDRAFTMPDEEKIGRADCDDMAVILFELDNVGGSEDVFIDVWEGQSCNTMNRIDDQETDCELLVSAEVVMTRAQPVEVPVRAIAGEECGDGGQKTLWFLVVTDPGSGQEPSAQGSIRVTLDFMAPGAPTDVRGGSGERQIPVSWDPPSTNDLESFNIYIDPNPGGGDAGPAGCMSSLISEGLEPDAVPSEVEVVRVGSGSATSHDLEPENITGDVAAVAITAVDEARNESNLSEVVCIRIVPTEGFWERYQANGGEVEPGCPCSALGPVHAQQAWPILLSLLALWRRRRTA